MNVRRWVWLGVFLALAVFLAPFLQEIILEGVIIPLAYFGWLVGQVVGSVSQGIYWVFIIFVIGGFAVGSLARGMRISRRDKTNQVPKRGPVETLALEIQFTKSGPYFKWVLANRLAKLAQAILRQSNDEETIAPRQLNGKDWAPTPEIQAYLENGLQRSFVVQPKRRFYSRREPTPFDLDLDQVITFLEAQQEKESEQSPS